MTQIITYIGKRLNTKNTLSHFYNDGERTFGFKVPLFGCTQIGAKIKGTPSNRTLMTETASEKDIAEYTIEELRSIQEYKTLRASKTFKVNNKIKEAIKLLKSVPLNNYEKYKMLDVIRQSIFNDKK